MIAPPQSEVLPTYCGNHSALVARSGEEGGASELGKIKISGVLGRTQACRSSGSLVLCRRRGETDSISGDIDASAEPSFRGSRDHCRDISARRAKVSDTVSRGAPAFPARGSVGGC